MEVSLKTEQKQTLSHKMIQSSEILSMAASQLEEYLNEQVLENPVLELTEKPPEQFDRGELEKYQWICSHDEQNRYLYQKLEANEDDPPEWNMDLNVPETLRDHLWSQLLTRDVPPDLEPAVDYLLDSLDARGYFTDPLGEFADRFNLPEEKAAEVISLVQSLEPAGVAAVSLEDCLCIQLNRQGKLTPELEDLILHHLPEIAKNQLPAIARSMKLPIETVKEYCALIRELNPRPCSLFTDVRQLSYIIPDVVVVKFSGHFDILLNESLYPDISLNGEYVRMCQSEDNDEVKNYLLDKIRQAQWLKQCIAQRNTTLFSVVQAIVSLQQDFFFRGPGHIKPLRLADAAEVLGIHESTVSRAIKLKYLQCSWGIFPLGYFFARTAVKAEAAAPISDATASDVKAALKEIIGQEPAQKPYSDRILADLLAEKGFPISRRTVAKYREEEGILGASGRKVY